MDTLPSSLSQSCHPCAWYLWYPLPVWMAHMWMVVRLYKLGVSGPIADQHMHWWIIQWICKDVSLLSTNPLTTIVTDGRFDLVKVQYDVRIYTAMQAVLSFQFHCQCMVHLQKTINCCFHQLFLVMDGCLQPADFYLYISNFLMSMR